MARCAKNAQPDPWIRLGVVYHRLLEILRKGLVLEFMDDPYIRELGFRALLRIARQYHQRPVPVPCACQRSAPSSSNYAVLPRNSVRDSHFSRRRERRIHVTLEIGEVRVEIRGIRRARRSRDARGISCVPGTTSNRLFSLLIVLCSIRRSYRN